MQAVKDKPASFKPYVSVDLKTGEVTYGSADLKRVSEVREIYWRPAWAIVQFLTKWHMRITEVFRV